MGWVMLCAAIITEVLATTSLKLSDGMTKLWPTVGTAVGYVISFILLARALKTFEVGVAYAVWSGIGTALIAAIGMFFLGEAVTAYKIAGVVLVIAGVVVLNLSGAH